MELFGSHIQEPPPPLQTHQTKWSMKERSRHSGMSSSLKETSDSTVDSFYYYQGFLTPAAAAGKKLKLVEKLNLRQAPSSL